MYEAVILAGGKGTRLKSVSGDIPKPMVEINNIPFLYYLMRKLESQSCDRIILSLCYNSNYFIKKIKEDRPVSCQVDFVIESEPMGTGGAIKKAASLVKRDKFLVLNGDTYCDIDYLKLIDFSENIDLVISGVTIDEASRYGTLCLDNNNNVLSLNEKGYAGHGIINSGIYVLRKDKIINFKNDVFSFESDFVKNFHGSFKSFIFNGYFIDIGIPEDYYKACQEIK